MPGDGFYLRPYNDGDLEAALALWLKAWSQAYPERDFAARLPRWKSRWENEILPVNDVIVALDPEAALLGVVTITPATGYLEQIYVDPAHQGMGIAEALLQYAKTRCPGGLTMHVFEDNVRALKFCLREGFKIAGESVNPLSNLKTYEMAWYPVPSPLAREG